jgi:hypothetical protein
MRTADDNIKEGKEKKREKRGGLCDMETMTQTRGLRQQ